MPGSVRVLDRRLIESYAGVFHTVDHVEGMLAEGFDSLDAFLTHMWSVTMIGAPKKWAAQAIEDLEKDARGWYGGSVGMISLDGEINTGITIRTIFLRDGVARYSAGATLLYDSVPGSGGARDAPQSHRFLPRHARGAAKRPRRMLPKSEDGRGVRLLLVDNEDCFIHTLANYVRQTGAEVITYRAGFSLDMIERLAPSLILVSPGPGPALRFRSAGSDPPRGQAGSSGIRRVPGFAGHGGGVRRRARRAGLSDARQAVRGSPHRRGRFRRAAGGVPRRPLSFFIRASARAFRPVWKSPRRAKTASSWASAIATCRWKRSNSIPNRS